jgi:hypothetical protein
MISCEMNNDENKKDTTKAVSFSSAPPLGLEPRTL